MVDYYSIIASALSRSSSKKTGRANYERAHIALLEALRDYEQSLLVNQQIALEATVCGPEAGLAIREAS
jgi:hypothetical protein